MVKKSQELCRGMRRRELTAEQKQTGKLKDGREVGGLALKCGEKGGWKLILRF